MKRVDIYSLLIRNGYKLPSDWKNVTEARADISFFMKENLELTDDIKIKISLYSDSDWKKLIWRLNDNGHIISSI